MGTAHSAINDPGGALSMPSMESPLPPYPRNQWYVAAWSDEVTRAPIERTILGESIVLYRSEDGRAVALDNRCAHRRYPLSKGRLIGDDIECGYHGFRFAPSGACVCIPSQERVPDKVGVRRYAVAEPSRWVWVFLGDADSAERTAIPEHPWLGDAALRVVGVDGMIEAPYALLNENLLDLTHLTFVHANSFGTPAVVASSFATELSDARAAIQRHLPRDVATAMHKRMFDIHGEIDRWMEQYFVPPSFHVVQLGFVPSGRPRSEGYTQWLLNFGTPETPARTRYFLASCRSYLRDDERVDEQVRGILAQTIKEDGAILEQQYRMTRFDSPPFREVSVAADAAALHGRKLLERMIRAEVDAGAALARPLPGC